MNYKDVVDSLKNDIVVKQKYDDQYNASQEEVQPTIKPLLDKDDIILIEELLQKLFDRRDIYVYNQAQFAYDIRDANVDWLLYDKITDLLKKVK